MKILIWLDDVRNPFQDDWLVFSPIEQPYKVIWLKSYQTFTYFIENFGLPAAICFDHDLSDFQSMKSGFPEEMTGAPWPEGEKTGMDCAKWLVEYCLDNNLELPKWNIQSANSAGKANIHGLLTAFENRNKPH